MITIINTGIGNFKSIQHMLTRIGENSILSKNPKDIEVADKLILPGIGSFDVGMQSLKDSNLIDVIKNTIASPTVKVLGICLGMQMLADSSEEGILPGLGIIKGHVRKFNFLDNCKNLKIPHMGWNYAVSRKKSILFSGYDTTPRFYFTHSYWLECDDESNVLSKTPYGGDFTSAVERDNRIYGVQFHPEKSHCFGLQLLKNFVSC